jgi:hypothetical protein
LLEVLRQDLASTAASLGALHVVEEALEAVVGPLDEADGSTCAGRELNRMAEEVGAVALGRLWWRGGFPRSFLRLLVVGFLLVALPLAAALVWSSWHAERLAEQSRSLIGMVPLERLSSSPLSTQMRYSTP